jgi:branched-chain amino acid transport system ATP-binding protein
VTPNAPLLRVDDVQIRFGGNVVVDGVTFEVAAGSVTALIGPNGAGKTSLFNAISGFVRASRGRIELNGKALLGRHPSVVCKHGVGRTFQSAQVFGPLTVQQNLCGGYGLSTPWLAGLEFLSLPGARRARARAEQQAVELAGRLGLTDVLDTQAAVLPVGTQKLVDLGRALAGEPKLLLADEPAAGLSAEERTRMASILADVARGGDSVLLVEHDMGFVSQLADLVHVLHLGRIIASGTPEEIRSDPLVVEAYLGVAKRDGHVVTAAANSPASRGGAQ